MAYVIGVQYHNFQIFQQKNNVVLAKCNCCSIPRWGVFVVSDKDKIFHYHGYDAKYAQKLFSSLASHSQSQ
jgi:hypothetical protein